jgi:hypothetical protein
MSTPVDRPESLPDGTVIRAFGLERFGISR